MHSDLRLKSVEVRFACPCYIQFQDQMPLSGEYTLVSLHNNDPDIIRVFLRLLQETFVDDRSHHSAGVIRQQILSIADLFSRLDDDSRDVVGLWGELHIIRSARNISRALETWSSSPRALYDFISVNFAIEVKATTKFVRQHRFSLEQLRPNADFDVFVGSLMLVERPGGETVSEIIDQIYAGIRDSEERSRFFRQCLRKGGTEIYGAKMRLAVLPDGTSLAVFEAANLPVPSVGETDQISRVKFELNLSNLSPRSRGEAARATDFALD